MRKVNFYSHRFLMGTGSLHLHLHLHLSPSHPIIVSHPSTLTFQLKYCRCHYHVFPCFISRYLPHKYLVVVAAATLLRLPLTAFRMTDDIVSYQQTAENLKLKLSLKKQIWTGTICSLSQQQPLEKIYQPLSWGVPPIVRKKQPKYDENEELLT